MPGLKAFIVGSAVAASFAASAVAADMPQMRPAIRTVEPESTPAWYLRIDLGYRATLVGSAVSAGGFPTLTDNRVDGHFWGGLGAGFKWGQFRTDLTADYGAEAGYTGQNGIDSATAKIQTVTGLANLYYDIGTWFGVTPYLGVGAGVAYTRVSQYQSATVPPLAAVGTQATYDFAWALMAGASYQMLPSVSLDLGYRFLDQGDAVTGSDAFGQLTLTKLQSHEMRIGLRWSYESPGSFVR